MDPDVGRQMGGRKKREPAGDVFFAERECFSCEQYKWIEDGAPGDLAVVERVVEMARADGVFGEDQRARARLPEGESPVANEHRQAIAAPVSVSRRDDLDIRGS